MSLNKNTKDFEYVTYLHPGPQQFFFVENRRNNDKRVRNIIIKPRQQEVEIFEVTKHKINILRREFSLKKSVFVHYKQDTNLYIEQLLIRDWENGLLSELLREVSNRRQIKKLMKDKYYRKFKYTYLHYITTEEYDFIKWKHIEPMIKKAGFLDS